MMKMNSTLKELLIGIFLVGILGQIVCLLFFEQHLYNAIGLWVGVLLSAGLAIHMQYSIEDGLDLMGEDGAKHIQKSAVLRMLVACIVIGIVFYFEWGNPLTLVLGIMALKIAVYLQPFVHKVLEKGKKGG